MVAKKKKNLVVCVCRHLYFFWLSTKTSSHYLPVLGLIFPPFIFNWTQTCTVTVQTWENCQVHSSLCTGLQRDQHSVRFHTHIVPLWGPCCVITVYFYSLDIKYAKNDETTDITFQLDSAFWRIYSSGEFTSSWRLLWIQLRNSTFQESLRMTDRSSPQLF